MDEATSKMVPKPPKPGAAKSATDRTRTSNLEAFKEELRVFVFCFGLIASLYEGPAALMGSLFYAYSYFLLHPCQEAILQVL
jgi:hypothetical protein